MMLRIITTLETDDTVDTSLQTVCKRELPFRDEDRIDLIKGHIMALIHQLPNEDKLGILRGIPCPYHSD